MNKIFQFVARQTSYCFATVPFVIISGYFAASYAFFIVYFSIDYFKPETMRAFSFTLIAMLLIVPFIHALLLGALRNFKLPAFLKFARRLNDFFANFTDYEDLKDDELLDLLQLLVRFPLYHMLIAILIVILVTLPTIIVEYLFSRSLYHLAITSSGGLIAGIIFCYFCYILTETLTADLRGECRKIISRRNMQKPNIYGISIRKKIIFIITIVFFSMAMLTYFLAFCNASLIATVGFLATTFLTVIVLTSLYFQSINSAFGKILVTTRELSHGGGELLHLGNNEKELIQFAENFNVSVKESIELRHNLEQKVEARTKDLVKKASELEEANRRLKELDQMKSNFLSSVSHELRTPLTSVLGFAKLIRKDFAKFFVPLAQGEEKAEKKATRINENLGIIMREGERLTRLINDVLDLAKIESGRFEWRDTVFPVGEAIKQAVQAASGQFVQKPDVKFSMNIPRDLPHIKADPDRLVQVIINLLNNAAKFTEQGHVGVDAVARADGWLEVGVHDTGTGIPPDDIDKVFNKFHQVTKGDTLKDKPNGSGLGLAICRQIIERYGGRIWAESKVGKGSKFTFILPYFTN
ncbi:MAG: HAMP domain-containing histidine kinase [Deltaproteobacteria bacterium]|nr:HAMP domain-containing histidine kinase [Deltaproteobacteria bacterium]MBW1735970.1 HAMP domain-containing histidine kinase [Deltaproteobacteria bacterium]MBW1908279.1 HAMP domain-containing histidine kinase [Deltaproteobacteria bacterium]